MEKFIASVTVNGNEVRLIKQENNYYIYWGKESNKFPTKSKLINSSGKKLTQKEAYSKFLKAAEAAQYLKFEKL